ncbi:UNVERIFIED_CONTAM: hypothetical protein DES50_108139 [Williamsia faeni]
MGRVFQQQHASIALWVPPGIGTSVTRRWTADPRAGTQPTSEIEESTLIKNQPAGLRSRSTREHSNQSRTQTNPGVERSIAARSEPRKDSWTSVAIRRCISRLCDAAVDESRQLCRLCHLEPTRGLERRRRRCKLLHRLFVRIGDLCRTTCRQAVVGCARDSTCGRGRSRVVTHRRGGRGGDRGLGDCRLHLYDGVRARIDLYRDLAEPPVAGSRSDGGGRRPRCGGRISLKIY